MLSYMFEYIRVPMVLALLVKQKANISDIVKKKKKKKKKIVKKKS